MGEARVELLDILRETRSYLALPENNFVWSSWTDCTEALNELDKLIATIEAQTPIQRIDLSVLFAPTGPIQEVSLSSGWAREFLALSERFDAAEQRFFASEPL
jgi:hypothetical protein